MKRFPSKSICVGVIVFVIFLFGAHRHAAGQDAEIDKLLAKRQELVSSLRKKAKIKVLTNLYIGTRQLNLRGW